MAKRVISAVLTLKDKDFSKGLRGAAKNVNDFDRKVQRTKNQVNDFGKKSLQTFKSIGAAAVALGSTAIAGLGTAVASLYKEMDTAYSMLKAKSGATGEELNELKAIATSVYKKGFGESIDQVVNDVATLNSMFSNLDYGEVQTIAEGAMTIGKLWGAETKEVGRAVQGMMNNFKGLSHSDALDLITTAFQKTGDYSNDLLDTFNEYAVHFSKLGLTAEEFTGILIRGAQAGAFNMDKVGDAVKEFGIRAIDGSKSTKEGFAGIGLSADEMAKKIGEGGESAQQAFMATIAALAAMEDPVERNAAGVALFGTMWEDLRDDVILSMSDGAAAVEGFEGATSRAAEAMQNNFASKMDKLWRTLKVGIAEAFDNAGGGELLDVLIKKAEEFIPVVENMVSGAVNFGNTIRDNWPIIKEVIGIVGTFVGILGAIKLGIIGVTAAQTAWNVVMNANPVGLIVMGVAALVTGIIWLWKNFDVVKEKANELWQKLLDNPMMALVTGPIGGLIAAGILLYQNWDTIKAKADELWTKLQEVFGGIYDWGVTKIQAVVGFFQGLKDKFDQFKESISNFTPPTWVTTIGGAIGKGISWVANKINGSHASGLNKVPFDGYVAELHKGEMVIPARQSERLRQQGYNINNINRAPISTTNTTNNTKTMNKIEININAQNMTTAQVIKELVPQLKLALANM